MWCSVCCMWLAAVSVWLCRSLEWQRAPLAPSPQVGSRHPRVRTMLPGCGNALALAYAPLHLQPDGLSSESADRALADAGLGVMRMAGGTSQAICCGDLCLLLLFLLLILVLLLLWWWCCCLLQLLVDWLASSSWPPWP